MKYINMWLIKINKKALRFKVCVSNIRKKVLINITLAKIAGAIFTALLLTFLKYSFTGNIHIDTEKYFINFSFLLSG